MGGITRTFLQNMIRHVDHAGRFWFGSPQPVAGEVLEASDWQPDELDVYCCRCGSSVGPGEWSRRGCAGCRNRSERRIADGIVRLGPYVDELREWVLATKYRQWHEMGDAFGRMLGRQVQRSSLVDVKRAIVVPMPMPWQRRMYRGIDHARVIAGAVAQDIGGTLVPMLRRSNGPTQASLEPGQRRTNAKRGISVKRRLGGWPLGELEVDVVLVDDVSTTGSSLRAAVQLLRELRPITIVAAVVAVSDESARQARRRDEGDVGAGADGHVDDAAVNGRTSGAEMSDQTEESSCERKK